MSHQEDQTSTTSATSATSAQSAQSPGSEQPDLPPYYCDDPRAYCRLCDWFIGDAYCKNPDCGRDRRDNFLDSADAMGKLKKFQKMLSKELSKATKPTESGDSSIKQLVHCGSGPADSSSKPLVYCESGPADSSSKPFVHCESRPADSSSEPTVHCESGPADSSNKLTVHCGSGPGRFCLNDTLLQQPQMLELPEGASWDTCSCGNQFVLGISDNVSANYCSQYCYDRR